MSESVCGAQALLSAQLDVSVTSIIIIIIIIIKLVRGASAAEATHGRARRITGLPPQYTQYTLHCSDHDLILMILLYSTQKTKPTTF